MLSQLVVLNQRLYSFSKLASLVPCTFPRRQPSYFDHIRWLEDTSCITDKFILYSSYVSILLFAYISRSSPVEKLFGYFQKKYI